MTETKIKSKQLNLLVKIIIAVILGIASGMLLGLFPIFYDTVTVKSYFGLDYSIEYIKSYSSAGIIITKIFMIFNSIFGNFLNFVIPLLIIGLVAPGIGRLGRDAGKLLLITIAIAYSFTIFAGFGTYFTTYFIYPSMLSNAQLITPSANLSASFAPYFTISMPPVTNVTSSLILAFVLGFGLAVTKTDYLMNVMENFRDIINKIISSVIVPLLPAYIFTIFLNITMVGAIGEVLAVFIKIIVLIFALTVILLLIFYGIAGFISRKNPFNLLKRMMPAYITALGTSSSAATIPITYQSTLKNGVRKEIAEFTVPLCATINLSGSMLKIVACSYAVIYTTGMDISFGSYSAFIFTLAIAMVAAPGVPGGAIMTALAPLSSILGFSAETNALMIALYLVMDSFGTATNVTSDGAIAVILDKIYKHDHHIVDNDIENS